MSNKPVVLFSDVMEETVHVGRRAIVRPINHPNLHNDGTWASTSAVEQVTYKNHQVSSFVTKNTVYKRDAKVV